MTITLTPEIEQAVVAEAQEMGGTPEQVAVDRLRQSLRLSLLESTVSPEETRRREALARVQSGYYAERLGPSRLSQDKAEEIEHEEQRWQ